MNTNQDIKEYADLYGFQTTRSILKERGFSTVSVREKTIPSMGSPCAPVSLLSDNADPTIANVVLHKDGSVTLKTDIANLRFWK